MVKALGFICGLVCGIGLIAVLMKVCNKFFSTKVKLGKCDYDERQLLARGKALKCAFITSWAYMICLGLISDLIHDMLSIGTIWIGLCISMVVFVGSCIINDAYVSLKESRKSIFFLLIIVIVINMIPAVVALKEESYIENGKLTVNSMNISIAITFLIIFAIFLGKTIYDKRIGCKDEED